MEERAADGIAWARSLLDDKSARRIACVTTFKEADTDGDGSLDEHEARHCLESMCKKMELDPWCLPEKLEELIATRMTMSPRYCGMCYEAEGLGERSMKADGRGLGHRLGGSGRLPARAIVCSLPP